MTTETVEQADAEIPALDMEKRQRQVDAAFLKSGTRKVGNLTLQPYTPSREVAGQAMGLHYAYVDKAGQERFRRTKLYPGCLRDVAIVMWLCAKATDDEIEAAGIEPRVAAKKANEWAKEQGFLNPNGDPFLDAYGAFFEIMDEIWQSQTVPVKKNTDSSNPTTT